MTKNAYKPSIINLHPFSPIALPSRTGSDTYKLLCHEPLHHNKNVDKPSNNNSTLQQHHLKATNRFCNTIAPTLPSHCFSGAASFASDKSRLQHNFPPLPSHCLCSNSNISLSDKSFLQQQQHQLLATNRFCSSSSGLDLLAAHMSTIRFCTSSMIKNGTSFQFVGIALQEHTAKSHTRALSNYKPAWS